MRRVCSVAAALAAVVVLAGWHSASARVRHAAISLGTHQGHAFVVDVWRDPADGETAFRMQGDPSEYGVLRGRSLATVVDGALDDVTVYSSLAAAWKIVHARFGLTSSRTSAALAAGQTVDRPALMNLPKADTTSGNYTFVRDFGTDLDALRRAARFAVPSPGRRLGGLPIVHVSLDRWLAGDPGYVAGIQYAKSLRPGSDQVLLNVTTPDTPSGSSYATFYGKSHDRIVGPGYEARRVDSDLIMRYHGSYVFVRIDGSQADRRVRSILRQIAHS